MKKVPELLVIGDNCFDITVKSDFDFSKDKNFLPDRYITKPAGTGVNFAVSFSRMGGKSAYFTPLSEDSFGREIANFLSTNSIKITGKTSSRRTALIIALVNEKGDRTTFALIKNTSYTDISLEEIAQTDLSGFDGVYISGGINTEAETGKEVLKIAQFLKAHDKKIFFDPQIRIGKEISGFVKVSEEIAQISDIVFANEEELSYISPNIFNGKFVVEKRGEKGAAIFEHGKEVVETDGIKVSVRDTTGAGDVFNAAFLFCFLSGCSTEESLKFANAAGAISVSKNGVYSPSFGEVERFLNEG